MRSRASIIRLVLVTGAAASLLWACARPGDGSAPPYEPVGSIEDLMAGMIDPSADIIYGSVAVVSTAAGVDRRVPQTDEDWLRVERAALTLAEAANLLRIPGRVVARADREAQPSSQVPELTPAEIDEKIAADPAQWTRQIGALLEQARRALEYARARNVEGLFDVGGDLDEVCENCHLIYWYPDAPRPPAAD